MVRSATLYSSQKSSNDVASFSQQLKQLNLGAKKVFVKIDIEGAEYIAFEDILKHSKNVAGIAVEIHFWYDDQEKAVNFLTKLSKDFSQCSCNFSQSLLTTYNMKGKIWRLLELPFINKNLVDRYALSADQTHPHPLDMPD